MRITSFELVNVGPLKRISVRGMADIVVFAGPNGVGKTHISSALIGFAQNPGASPNVHMTVEASAPDIAGIAHDSMTSAWRVIEYIPKSAVYREWPERRSLLGFYVPDCEPRVIPEGAILHESAIRRMNELPSYRPVNVPHTYGTFPLSLPPL
ncbi:hypothetical protein ABIF61_005191 [Bradyrhizobium japonicum]|uniref:hypothetical protein n=1 Tax=Bradyrhizobium ottawaense TaxID=931866 RepID=UPI00348107DE